MMIDNGDVAKLVDALASGASAARCRSSSLLIPTRFKKTSIFNTGLFFMGEIIENLKKYQLFKII